MEKNYNNVKKNNIEIFVLKEIDINSKPRHRDFFTMSRFMYPVYKAAITYAKLETYMRIRRDDNDELVLSCSDDCPVTEKFFKFVEHVSPRYYECVHDIMHSDIQELIPLMKELSESQCIQLLRFRDQARKKFYAGQYSRTLCLTIGSMVDKMDVSLFVKLYEYIVAKYRINV